MKKDRILLASLYLGLLSALSFYALQGAGPGPAMDAGTMVERGRAVYIAEGCIHCHSQYVRPVGPDQELWGPVTQPEATLEQVPVLIGNRRQGPDLATVGIRRTPDWNRRHLKDPRSITPGSRMPSYRHLFEEGNPNGEDLLAYLDQLKPSGNQELVERIPAQPYPYHGENPAH